MRLLLDFAYLIACIVASPWLAVPACAWADGAISRSVSASGSARALAVLHLAARLVGRRGRRAAAARRAARARPSRARRSSSRRSPRTGSRDGAQAVSAASRRAVARAILSFVVARFLRRFDPRLLVIVESEFWPNLHQRRARPRRARSRSSTARCRRSRSACTRVRGSMPRVLAKLDAARRADARSTRSGCERSAFRQRALHVTGNMKYDLARAPAPTPSAGRELRASSASRRTTS